MVMSTLKKICSSSINLGFTFGFGSVQVLCPWNWKEVICYRLTVVNVKKTVVYLQLITAKIHIENGKNSDITSAALRQCQRADSD